MHTGLSLARFKDAVMSTQYGSISRQERIVCAINAIIIILAVGAHFYVPKYVRNNVCKHICKQTESQIRVEKKKARWRASFSHFEYVRFLSRRISFIILNVLIRSNSVSTRLPDREASFKVKSPARTFSNWFWHVPSLTGFLSENVMSPRNLISANCRHCSCEIESSVFP